MKKLISAICILLAPFGAMAQHTLKGSVSDTTGDPMSYTTVSLLQPQDSTLAFFGITNTAGEYEIKNITAGKYIMQAAFMGFKTWYKPVEIPVAGDNAGRIVLRTIAKELAEVEISTERVPLLIKKDTIEYNANAFKTKPDAAVEDLLKKLPGLDVDRAGNIKAQGDDVTKVLVDGKEFFGDDPKVATKNLPADAIKKVQVFDRKSDASQFTGIDDGSRERTINLMLKDGKKSGYFGDVQAGGGTDERYRLNAKLYKFTRKSQFAAIGLLNNTNQAGFSVQDYINFNGGVRNLLSGGMNDINLADAPVDFGQPQTGQITSGAAGLNYSYEYGKNQRIALSYMGNGSDKKLRQQTFSRNFTQDESFIRNSNERQDDQNYAHRVNVNWRNDMDSMQQITLRGNAGLTQSRSAATGFSSSEVRDLVLNQMDSRSSAKGSGISGDGSLGYLKKFDGRLSVLKLAANSTYKKDLTEAQWHNITSFLPIGQTISDRQFQNTRSEAIDYGGDASIMYSLGNSFYLEPGLTAGSSVDRVKRDQGPIAGEAAITDSLSADFSRVYTYARPLVSLRKSTQKIQYSIGLAYEAGALEPMLTTKSSYGTRKYGYLLPSLDWQNNYSMGKRLSLLYTSQVNAPAAQQLLPVPNITSPLSRYFGNAMLRPEYEHRTQLGWLWFDQFSFTSLFANITGTYTHDKISTSRFIYADLSEVRTLENIPDDYRLQGSLSFNKPIRQLGITVDVSASEQINKGMNLVNGIANKTTVFTHELKLNIGNRKKEKFDVQIGGSGSLSDARYSIDRNMNNIFLSLTGFADISYQPSGKWHIGFTADVTQYNARSFNEAIVVPLLKSEVSYYFMKANRGVLTLEGFDLLNKNKSIQRISQLNYLTEVRSNIIGQYFMLSFKYRLSKSGNDANLLDIHTK